MSTKFNADVIEAHLYKLRQADEVGSTALLLLGGLLASKECSSVPALQKALESAMLLSYINLGDEAAVRLLVDYHFTDNGEADGMTDLGKAVISCHTEKWTQRLLGQDVIAKTQLAILQNAAEVYVDGTQHDLAHALPSGNEELLRLTHRELKSNGLIANPAAEDMWVATGAGLVVLWRRSQLPLS